MKIMGINVMVFFCKLINIIICLLYSDVGLFYIYYCFVFDSRENMGWVVNINDIFYFLYMYFFIFMVLV